MEKFSSPLVGEAGGGPAASAADKNLLLAPPPNPPHKGEGLKRLALPANATKRARALRKNSTAAEKTLWAAVRTAFPEMHWRQQVPMGPYVADFCSHGHKLIIEVDGGQHSPAADAARTRFLESQGYRVIRFWNNDVLENIDAVVGAVARSLES